MGTHIESSDFTKHGGREAMVTVRAQEEIRVGEVAVRVLVEGEQSAGSVALFEFDGPAGVLTWTIEGSSTDVGPGETLVIPRGAVHRFDNAGDADAAALAIVT